MMSQLIKSEEDVIVVERMNSDMHYSNLPQGPEDRSFERLMAEHRQKG